MMPIRIGISAGFIMACAPALLLSYGAGAEQQSGAQLADLSASPSPTAQSVLRSPSEDPLMSSSIEKAASKLGVASDGAKNCAETTIVARRGVLNRFAGASKTDRFQCPEESERAKTEGQQR